MNPDLGLEYIVRRPRVESKLPPLVVLLHGVGSNEEDLFGLASFLDPRLLIVSTRGPLSRAPGSYAWFNVRFVGGRPVINPEDAERSRQAILRFLGDVPAKLGADPGRVFLLGFSQGAIMSLSVMLTAPELLAGVVALSGRILPEVKPLVVPPDRLRGFPVLVQHGAYDDMLPIDYGRASRDYLLSLPVDLDYREYAMGHQISDESLNAFSNWLSARLDVPNWRERKVL